MFFLQISVKIFRDGVGSDGVATVLVLVFVSLCHGHQTVLAMEAVMVMNGARTPGQIS